jgi:hypothetical protein
MYSILLKCGFRTVEEELDVQLQTAKKQLQFKGEVNKFLPTVLTERKLTPTIEASDNSLARQRLLEIEQKLESLYSEYEIWKLQLYASTDTKLSQFDQLADPTMKRLKQAIDSSVVSNIDNDSTFIKNSVRGQMAIKMPNTKPSRMRFDSDDEDDDLDDDTFVPPPNWPSNIRYTSVILWRKDTYKVRERLQRHTTLDKVLIQRIIDPSHPCYLQYPNQTRYIYVLLSKD